EADRLRKIEEFKRQEEERKNKWLTEAQELEKSKDKKLRDKEEASRLMELELERRRLEEAEREKRQQEERLARIKREAEERAAAEERHRLEQEALIENSRAARELAKKREEETKQREETLKRDIGKSSKVKREDSVRKQLTSNDVENPLPTETTSNNPFLKFGAQDKPIESTEVESTNPFYKFTSGVNTNKTSTSREVQDDDDWNVIDKNEDSSDDDFTVPPPTVFLTDKSTMPKPSSNIPVAPPAPPSNISSNVPSAPPLPPSSSNIPSAPPLPPSSSKIPSAPPLPPPSSNIPSAPPLPPSASNLPIAPPTSIATSNTSQSQPSGARSALLNQIQLGKKLRPTQTNDRSSPLAAGRTNSSPTPAASSDGSAPSAGRIGLGALFAGGVPKLQSRGGVETSRSFTEDTRSTTNSRQRTILKADRRISSDLFGSLASDQLANEGKLSAPTTPDITQTESKEYSRTTDESSNLVESPTATSSSEIDVDFAQEFRVKSLYSYSGNGADDLSFEAGISFLAHPSKIQSNADWWYGVIEQTGAKGWFPKSYVEIVKEEKEVCKAKVLFEWNAQSPDQLDIKQGSVVSILDKSLGDWWKAEYEGAKGIIPSNYVEEISSYSVRNKLDKDMTGVGETSNDDTSEDESNENNGDIRSKSDIVNDSKSDNIFDIVFTDPITIPKFSIQSPKNASFIKSSIEIDSRSASPNSSEPTEFVRSPSPTRLFGSSPIITVPWMQIGSFKRERNNSTDSNLNPQIMPQRPESPVSINQGPSAPLWAGIMDSKTLKSITKEERKRQEAIYELIITEQTYLRDLQIIIELFYGPLQNFLSDQELSTLFCNIQDILLCNTAILSDLEQRQEEDAYFVSKVGDILLKHSKDLTLYTKYCGNQLNATKFLQKKCSVDKKFADFLKKIQQDPQCGSLDLSSFLLKPLQRITRYPLLIRQILHYTSKDNIDHQNMMQALHKAEKILEETNEAAREQENQMKLNEISNLVDLENLEEKLDLTSMTRLVGKRQFILEGPLKKAKSGRNLYGYLFNDILLLRHSNKKTTAKGHKYSLYKPPIPLNEIFVKDIGLDETCFQVVHIEDVINLRASNVSVKRQWVNQLETASGYCLAVERKIQKGESSSSPMDHNHISGTLRVLVYDGVVPSEHESERFNIHVYCQVQLNRQIFKTKIVKGTNSPQWNQHLMFSVITLEDTLKITLFNFDKYTTDEYLGQAEIGLHFLTYYGDNETDKIKLELKDIPPGKSNGHVSIFLSYKATD
ncbi:3066_t:CDS:10, partial [Cetraspora pellucida]